MVFVFLFQRKLTIKVHAATVNIYTESNNVEHLLGWRD